MRLSFGMGGPPIIRIVVKRRKAPASGRREPAGAHSVSSDRVGCKDQPAYAGRSPTDWYNQYYFFFFSRGKTGGGRFFRYSAYRPFISVNLAACVASVARFVSSYGSAFRSYSSSNGSFSSMYVMYFQSVVRTPSVRGMAPSFDPR